MGNNSSSYRPLLLPAMWYRAAPMFQIPQALSRIPAEYLVWPPTAPEFVRQYLSRHLQPLAVQKSPADRERSPSPLPVRAPRRLQQASASAWRLRNRFGLRADWFGSAAQASSSRRLS